MLHAHHPRWLLRRWRLLARKHGLAIEKFHDAAEAPLYVVRTPALGARGGIYLSAGIHGDEAGSTEGLYTWAAALGAQLRELPLMIFPCLNPWGLRNNKREDAEGIDRNRVFHRDDLRWVQDWRRAVADHEFAAAVMLHEDYDAQGIYLYELNGCAQSWGAELLHAAERLTPIEPRRKVDGHPAEGGVVTRLPDLALFEEIGYPESIWLHQRHAAAAFTVETPSEFAIERRVAAHEAVLRAVCAKIFGS